MRTLGMHNRILSSYLPDSPHKVGHCILRNGITPDFHHWCPQYDYLFHERQSNYRLNLQPILTKRHFRNTPVHDRFDGIITLKVAGGSCEWGT